MNRGLLSISDEEIKAVLAHEFGYGNALIEVSGRFIGLNTSTKGLFATLAASHPDPDQRIGYLQKLRKEQ